MADKNLLVSMILRAVDDASSTINRIGKGLGNLGTQMKDLGATAGALSIAGAQIGGIAAAIALPLKASTDYSEAMQGELAHLRTAMTETGALREKYAKEAEEQAGRMAVAHGMTAMAEEQAYYIARSNTLNHADALAAMETATKLTIGTTETLDDAQRALEPTMRALTTDYINFGDKLKDPREELEKLADQMAFMQTQKAFKDIGEVVYAHNQAAPSAVAAGTDMADMNAALILASVRGKHGAEAGTVVKDLLEKLGEGGKLYGYAQKNAHGGIDLGKTLDVLASTFGALDPKMRMAALTTLGFQGDMAGIVSEMIQDAGQYGELRKQLENSKGANNSADATREAAYDYQIAKTAASFDELKKAIGDSLLGPMTKVAQGIGYIVTAAAGIATAHPQIVKFVAVFAAVLAVVLSIGAAIAGVVAGIMLLGVAGPVVGTIMTVVIGVGSALGLLIASIATAGSTIGNFFGILTGVTAISSLIGLIMGIVHAVEFVVTHFNKAGYEAGVALVKSIGRGIEDAIMHPVKAIAKVAAWIDRFIPHSPAKEGPLANLNRINLVETLAEGIRPAPAIAAIKKVARAAAMALPMLFGPAMLPVSAAFGGFGQALTPFSSPGGHGPAQVHEAPEEKTVITLHFSPTVIVNPGAGGVDGDNEALKELIRGMLEDQAHEMYDVWNKEKGRRERTGFLTTMKW